jgi:hypothetical protein
MVAGKFVIRLHLITLERLDVAVLAVVVTLATIGRSYLFQRTDT